MRLRGLKREQQQWGGYLGGLMGRCVIKSKKSKSQSPPSIIAFMFKVFRFNRIITLPNMLQAGLQLFHPITAFDTEVHKQFEGVIIKTPFFVANQQGIHSQIIVGLTDNFLLCCWKVNGVEQHFYCKLSFDLKFEVLRKEWPDQKTPGIPYGLRFEKDKNHETLDFFCNHPGIVNQWSLILTKKINQRNFHQLFKAKKKIGKGAFATVYLAERLTDKKLVAVKAFSKEKQYSGDKGKQSLENEIKIMRGIDHSNVMKLEGVYETQNSIYVILEYLEGCQLNEELKNGKKYTLNESISIIKQILSALKHLAEKRIIHRDLKPENIMFKKPNSLDLGICDFGLATYADEEKYLFVRCGTPGFVAPEIINIKDMSTKSEPISDIFSAGIIFHYLLFGHSIFPGKKYNEVLTQNRSCDFTFEKSQYESLPPAVLDLLKRMLQKNPKYRINSQQGLKHEVFEHVMEIEEEKPLKEVKNGFENISFCFEKEKEKKSSMISENSVFMNKNEISKKKYPSFNNSDYTKKIKPYFQKML